MVGILVSIGCGIGSRELVVREGDSIYRGGEYLVMEVKRVWFGWFRG